MGIDGPEPSEEDLSTEKTGTPRERYWDSIYRVIDKELKRGGRDGVEFSEDDVREIKTLELELYGKEIPQKGIVLKPEDIAKSKEFLSSYIPDGIRRARSENEPPISGDDIDSLEDLIAIALNGKVVKYTTDSGESWHYARLRKIYPEDLYVEDDSFFVTEGTPTDAQPEKSIRPEILFEGVTADEEIISYGPSEEEYNSGSMSQAFNEQSFRDGLVVRPTTPEEVEDMKFSYDFLRKYDS